MAVEEIIMQMMRLLGLWSVLEEPSRDLLEVSLSWQRQCDLRGSNLSLMKPPVINGQLLSNGSRKRQERQLVRGGFIEDVVLELILKAGKILDGLA